MGIHYVHETKNQVGKEPCRYISFEEPQDSRVYYYHVFPVLLIKNLGGIVADNSSTVSETTSSGMDNNKVADFSLMDSLYMIR